MIKSEGFNGVSAQDLATKMSRFFRDNPDITVTHLAFEVLETNRHYVIILYHERGGADEID